MSKLDCLKLNSLYGCLDDSDAFRKRKYETICDFLGLESTYPKKKKDNKDTKQKDKYKNTTDTRKTTTAPKTTSKPKPKPVITTKKPNSAAGINKSKQPKPTVTTSSVPQKVTGKNTTSTPKSSGWGLNKLYATTSKPNRISSTTMSMKAKLVTPTPQGKARSFYIPMYFLQR